MYKAELTAGVDTTRFINETFSVTGGIEYDLFMNPLYNPVGSASTLLSNFHFTFAVKVSL
jgi:hypothetical protein